MKLLPCLLLASAPSVTTALAAPQFGPLTDLVNVPTPSDADQMDFDFDGDLDLVVSSISAGTVYTVENLSDGTFGLPQAIAPNGTIADSRNVRVGDINGDMLPDVVATGFTDGKVIWVPLVGAASFGTPVEISSTVMGATDMIVEDLDGDGDLDVVSAAANGDALYFHENMGSGTFEEKVVITNQVDRPNGIALGDFDSDGTPDLVSASSTDGKVAWYSGAGDGTFGVQRIITTGATGASDVIVADLDNDGLDDVAYCSEAFGNRRLRWSRNTGGLFASPQTLDLSALGATTIAAADMDEDGDIDLACALEGSVRLYENFGSGFFAAPQTVASSLSQARICEFLDIDNDLDLDIVTATRQGTDRLRLAPNIRELGSTYCTSNANSTGTVARMFITGSGIAERNRLVLAAEDLPPSSFGIFVTSRTQDSVPNPGGSEGILCLGGGIGRYVAAGQIQFSGVSRAFQLEVDLDLTPEPMNFASIQAGETWNFQAWYRDIVGGAQTSNFTDAVSLTFD